MHSFSYCFWLLICFMLWFLLCSICIYQFYLFVFICLSSIFIAFDLYASSFQLIFIWSPLYLVSLGLILFLQHAFCMHDMLRHVRLGFTFPYQFNNESHVPYRINYQFGKLLILIYDFYPHSLLITYPCSLGWSLFWSLFLLFISFIILLSMLVWNV